MNGSDNDRRLDAFERMRSAQPTASEEPPRPAAQQTARKEPSQDAFDAMVETVTYSLTAPSPVQAWSALQNVASAAGGSSERAPAREVSGVRLYPLIEKELPKTIRSDATQSLKAGDYTLHAQIARGPDGKESVAYYAAVRHGRSEFAVGKDSVESFRAHYAMYEQQADSDWGITRARLYEQDNYRTGEMVSQGDVKGAVIQNYQAWDHAWHDPVFALQRAADIALASAPAASAIREPVGMRAATSSSEPIRMRTDQAASSRSAEIESRSRMARPTFTGDATMPARMGVTDQYGNVTYSTNGSAKDVALAQSHEAVHSFLSPKALNGLHEFRANAAMTAYDKSQLCRYLEEALAESVAEVKVNGFRALPDGITFPITHGYVELSRVVGEAAVGTVIYGGILYGVVVVENKQ